MGTQIESTRSIRSRGGRIRPRLIGEALEPSRMSGVRTPAMGNPMRSHAAVSEVHQVKPRCARGKGEVGDADKVSIADAVVVSVQRIERTSKQSGSYLVVDTFCTSESDSGSCGLTSKAGNRKIDKKASRNQQDIELQRNYAHV
jgi:hypothetical protein